MPEKVLWSNEVEWAFQRFETSSPIPRNPNFNVPFLAQTDISKTALAAVLLQEFSSEEHLVVYISRKLNPAERHYAAIKKVSPCY